MHDKPRWDTTDPKAFDKAEHEKQRAMHLLDECASIEQRQHSHHELNLWLSTLYANRVIPAFRWGDLVADQEFWPADLRTEDLVFAIGEAMVSKACSSPIKPTPVPHGQSWKTERAVRELDSFLLGVTRQTKAEVAAIGAFRDAYVANEGWIRAGYDKKKKSLHVENIFFDNVIIDARECANRAAPRTYYIRQVLPREAVEHLYGVELGRGRRYQVDRTPADGWVVIVEAYRLDGRHVVACCDQLLVDEPWKHEWVPLVMFNWNTPLAGTSGRSGVELMVPYQVIQNDLNDAIKKSQDIRCVPRLLQHAGSNIDVQHWDNEAGRILMYSGVAPQPFTWDTELTELYQERERNFARAYSAMGLSEMFGNADMPNQVRLDSSAGLREARNMEDARHLDLWTRFQEFRLEITKTILRVLAHEPTADAFTSRYVPGGAKASAKNIPWEAVKHLTEDEFSWTLEAVPLSQMSPAARRELVRDWTSRGLLTDQEEARRMLGDPNLERIEDLELAAADDISRHISLLEDGDFEEPTELTNITLGVKKVQANYHRLKNYSDVKTEVLQNHIAWIVKAVSIQQAAVQPPQQLTAFSPTQGVAGTSAATAPHEMRVTNNF